MSARARACGIYNIGRRLHTRREYAGARHVGACAARAAGRAGGLDGEAPRLVQLAQIDENLAQSEERRLTRRARRLRLA